METWVLTPLIGRLLGRFHHRVEIRLEWMKPQKRTDGTWSYPPIEDAIQAESLEVMETYIYRHQNTAVQCILT